MAVKSRKAEHTEATRAALLKVARKLFAERGYADSGIEEVAQKARVTRGALYHHFRDKQDLFAAVLENEERSLTGKIALAAAKAPDAWARLVAGCEAFLDAALEPAIQRIMLIDAPAVLGWARWREMDANYGLRLTREGLQAAVDEGFIERQPLAPLAHILLGAIDEAAMLTAHAQNPAATKAEVSASIMRLLSGLKIRRAEDR